MLEFAGTDASRPLKIGHVEMYCGNGIICGHGSGRPSYKDIVAYCKSRYASFAPGGWRKGLVCVRRYIRTIRSLSRNQKSYQAGARSRTAGVSILEIQVSQYAMPGIWIRTVNGIGSMVPGS
uniref:hypothetical protein n=1 Tax=Clostridium sp. NkU-1 TaxID=1095009 RepID=UPI0032611E3D